MRFLPLFAKRIVWGFVGDMVNASVMMEDMLNDLQRQHNKS